MTFFRQIALPFLIGTFAVPAHAAELLYELSGVGTTISFAVDERPLLKTVEVDGFVIGNVLVQLNGVSQVRDIGFVRNLSEGGFIILGTGINLAGPQLFTGPFAAPTLVTGNFALTGFADRSLQYSLQVQPAITAVPEPFTWLCLVIGFGLLGGAMRRRPAIGPMKSI